MVKTGLLDAIKQDFALMKDKFALVRVNALPLNSAFEIEMRLDSSRYESGKLDKLWKSQPSQKFYKTLDDYENAKSELEVNMYGEVYYQKDMINLKQLATRRAIKNNPEGTPQSNILGVTPMIPALEIIDVFTGE